MKTDDIRVTPRWARSKEEIWDEKFGHLEERPAERATGGRRRWLPYTAAAAVVAVLVVISAAFLYDREVVAPRGEQAAVLLPDGSEVWLNAESRISYKPLWWRLSRRVKMAGEVYFEVEAGRKFSVTGPGGTVTVLGTAFNVRDRAEGYSVTCLTGKVEVSHGGESVLLTGGMEARHKGGRLAVRAVAEPSRAAEWTSRVFSFTAVPLREVIAEIERQYDITVAAPDSLDYLYTGRFTGMQEPQQVLEILGRPFGITLQIVE